MSSGPSRGGPSGDSPAAPTPSPPALRPPYRAPYGYYPAHHAPAGLPPQQHLPPYALPPPGWPPFPGAPPYPAPAPDRPPNLAAGPPFPPLSRTVPGYYPQQQSSHAAAAAVAARGYWLARNQPPTAPAAAPPPHPPIDTTRPSSCSSERAASPRGSSGGGGGGGRPSGGEAARAGGKAQLAHADLWLLEHLSSRYDVNWELVNAVQANLLANRPGAELPPWVESRMLLRRLYTVVSDIDDDHHANTLESCLSRLLFLSDDPSLPERCRACLRVPASLLADAKTYAVFSSIRWNGTSQKLLAGDRESRRIVQTAIENFFSTGDCDLPDVESRSLDLRALLYRPAELVQAMNAYSVSQLERDVLKYHDSCTRSLGPTLLEFVERDMRRCQPRTLEAQRRGSFEQEAQAQVGENLADGHDGELQQTGQQRVESLRPPRDSEHPNSSYANPLGGGSLARLQDGALAQEGGEDESDPRNDDHEGVAPAGAQQQGGACADGDTGDSTIKGGVAGGQAPERGLTESSAVPPPRRAIGSGLRSRLASGGTPLKLPGSTLLRQKRKSEVD